MDKKKPHQIAAYIRVSTEEQAENPEGSIKNQEERIRQAVQFKNMEDHFGELAHVFVDRAKSGKDTNRPALQGLLAAIRRKEITLVLVTELSRLSRSIKDFSAIWELMQKHGCSFMSLRENFDTTTAAGEMVLYSLANIAQFERKQVSERVAANFRARAERGLYNGGVLPLGYKLLPSQPGILGIDEPQAELVKQCFRTFLDHGSLSPAAKWLNANGFAMKRESQGGYRPRLGHFTCQNLKYVLTNQAYIGIRTFKAKGELKQTKALWPAIINEEIFKQAQDVLALNRKRKPPTVSRYPFLLSGLTTCATCNGAMVGKSAHGNSGKVPYYEHGWATRRQGCILNKTFSCTPFRVPAKKLEPAVWEKIFTVLSNETIAREIVEKSKAIHAERSKNSERDRAKARIQSYATQLELLAERLSQLPKSVSPVPVFKQMEKIEALKQTEQDRLTRSTDSDLMDEPIDLVTYRKFLKQLSQTDQGNNETRAQIVQKLIHKIEILPEGLRIHFYAGKSRIRPDGGHHLSPTCSPGPRNENPLLDSSRSLTHPKPGLRGLDAREAVSPK